MQIILPIEDKMPETEILEAKWTNKDEEIEQYSEIIIDAMAILHSSV